MFAGGRGGVFEVAGGAGGQALVEEEVGVVGEGR